MMDKSKCKLPKENKDPINLLASARRVLIENGQFREAEEMTDKAIITRAYGSYDQVLKVISEFVEVSQGEKL